MHKKICFELLTKGSYNFKSNEERPDITELNKKFRDLNCAVKYWYDKTSLILVDNNEKQIGKSETARKDVEFFKNIINKENITLYARKDMHIQNGWIVEENGKLTLAKKFILQYQDFIRETNSKWNICKICNILVYDTNEHEYCTQKRRELLSKESILQ